MKHTSSATPARCGSHSPIVAAPPAFLELHARWHHQLFLAGRHRREPLPLSHRFGQFLARPFLQARLLVEQLQLRRTAGLREVDHAFRPRCDVRQVDKSSRIVAFRLGANRIPIDHEFGKRQRPQTQARTLAEEIAARGFEHRVVALHCRLIASSRFNTRLATTAYAASLIGSIFGSTGN